MQEVRDAAIELHKAGRVSITQKGQPVDVGNIKGPIRIKINQTHSTIFSHFAGMVFMPFTVHLKFTTQR